MKRVKTTTRFTDLKEDVVRELDDEFNVTKERFEEIKQWVVEIPQPKPKKATPKKKKGD